VELIASAHAYQIGAPAGKAWLRSASLGVTT
jgi:hypothetical protein